MLSLREVCKLSLISRPLSSAEDVILPECRTNAECPSNKACINQLCQDPCISNRCGLNAECTTINHHPSCHCQHGLAGDPQIQCFRRKLSIQLVSTLFELSLANSLRRIELSKLFKRRFFGKLFSSLSLRSDNYLITWIALTYRA